jgi:hypothetical protein
MVDGQMLAKICEGLKNGWKIKDEWIIDDS